MLGLALRNLLRRPLRNGLTVAGLGLAVAVLACLGSFGVGYQRGLRSELEQMGLQMMLVPLGCPYDAAARVLKGRPLDNSLPEAALDEVRHDPAVAVASPLLMAALPARSGRADIWVGLDETARALKPWWQSSAGASWFPDPESVILGASAAELEMRGPGDLFYSPETGRQFKVAGVLERSGTSDDSLFFIPLRTAQEMFHLPGRLTAIAIRLRDPALLPAASRRLQRIPGAQVVTLTEMMGTFLNLIGAVRTLLVSTAGIAVAISMLGVFNTLLTAVVERAHELGIMRALGASRAQIMRLVAVEGLVLGALGSVVGVLLALAAGQLIENLARQYVPLAPSNPLFSPDSRTVVETVLLSAAAGLMGALYPAWRAGQLQPAEALKGE